MSELVPTLRFSEFDHHWERCKLNNLSEIRSASRVHKEQWTDFGVPFFRSSDVVATYKGKKNNKAFISVELFKELSKKSGRTKKGDLLITGGGSIGVPYLVTDNEPLYFKDADLLWLKKKDTIDGFFLYEFFLTPKFKRYLRGISHTGTISHYTIEQAKSTPINLPVLKEQQKIADFLTSVDSKISQLTEKHSLLTQYKKGVMQQIFSQQLRFKDDDGSEFGEWEVKKLIDITIFIKDGTHGTHKRYDSGVPMLSAVNITKEHKVNFKKAPNISENDYSKIHSKYIIQQNDLLLTVVGTIGRTAIVDTSQKFTLQRSVAIIRFNQNYSVHFYKQLISSYLFQKELFRKANITAQPGIYLGELSKLLVTSPCLAEQEKIVQFLQAIDAKIDATSQQLEQTKLFKKGLLQQMFV